MRISGFGAQQTSLAQSLQVAQPGSEQDEKVLLPGQDKGDVVEISAQGRQLAAGGAQAEEPQAEETAASDKGNAGADGAAAEESKQAAGMAAGGAAGGVGGDAADDIEEEIEEMEEKLQEAQKELSKAETEAERQSAQMKVQQYTAQLATLRAEQTSASQA